MSDSAFPVFPGFALMADYSVQGDTNLPFSANLLAIPTMADANAPFILMWSTFNIAHVDIKGTYNAPGMAALPPTTITVNGQSSPWRSDGALNVPYYFYGDDTGQDPAVVQVLPGDSIAIQYVSGLWSVSAPIGSTYGNTGNNWGSWDAEGNVAAGAGNGVVGGPGQFVTPTPLCYSASLMGAFTDSTGSIVAQPFTIGNSRTLTVPDGATQLQMGINDGTYFDDNSGAIVVQTTITRMGLVPTTIDTGLIATTGSGLFSVPGGIAETTTFTMTCYDAEGNIRVQPTATVVVPTPVGPDDPIFTFPITLKAAGTVSFSLYQYGGIWINLTRANFGDGSGTLINPANPLTHDYNSAGVYDFMFGALTVDIRSPAVTISGCPNLTSIVIPAEPELVQLDVDSNGLTSLDISSQSGIAALLCNNNQLTELDVSGQSQLRVLYCYDNHLTTLDISHNPLLTQVYAANNALTQTAVDGILAAVVANGRGNPASSEVDLSGGTNAAPSSQGIANVAILRGWGYPVQTN